MKRLVFALSLVACGHATTVTRPVPLANVSSHVTTLEERRVSLCAKNDLVALEAPLFVGSEPPMERGVVRSVAVLDTASHPVDVDAQILALVARDAELDPAQTREVLRRLWTTGKFDDVALETSRDRDNALALVFRVSPRREVSNVFVSGAPFDAELLHLSARTPYDPVAIVSARASLSNELKKDGHLDASVVVSSVFADATHRAIDVCVRVDRGPRVTLDKIVVRGSAYGPALEAAIAGSTNVHGEVLDDQVLERDLLVMGALLFDRGLLTNKLDKKIDRHDNELVVTVDVTDGPVYRYSHLDVRGDLAGAKTDYMALMTPKRGDVFNRSVMLKVMDDIRALDKTRGRETEIDPETTLDEKTHTVALVLSLHNPAALAVVDLRAGQGRVAKKGDVVSVGYKGSLTDGTVFDTSANRAPLDFTIGSNMVIQGFERGVTGMKVGGKRRVTIPPALGYGTNGAPPKIPANATLVFEIELLAIR